MPPGKRQECETVKKGEKIKNGEGPSSGKKREKETKVCFAFHIYGSALFLFSDAGLFVYLAFFKIVVLLIY